MEEAKLVFSWNGILSERINALNIKGREHARKLGFFVDDSNKLVYWKNWGTIEKTGRKRKPHFCHYPVGRSQRFEVPDVQREFSEREQQKGETAKHKRAKEAIAELLRRLIREGQSINWSFNDPDASDFHFSGNLLADVVEVKTEYPVHTPFGRDYQLDIALLGERIAKHPIILGGIEIEFTHKFEMSKCLFCKCLGFPLVCVDIEELNESDISEEWAYSALIETTRDSNDGRRRNYIYLHDTLYPVYINIPSYITNDKRHQYVVFVGDESFDKLYSLLEKLKSYLGIKTTDVLIQPLQCKNEQMKSMLENEGSIAGPLWKDYNENRFLRINLDRPYSKKGAIYKYHLAMSSLLNAYFKTLVPCNV